MSSATLTSATNLNGLGDEVTVPTLDGKVSYKILREHQVAKPSDLKVRAFKTSTVMAEATNMFA